MSVCTVHIRFLGNHGNNEVLEIAIARNNLTIAKTRETRSYNSCPTSLSIIFYIYLYIFRPIWTNKPLLDRALRL